MYDKYIGIPYLEHGRSSTGVDCWGLVRLFYKQEFDIDLPSYVEEYTGSYDPKLSETIETYSNNWTKTVAPKPGDVCLFNILGEPTHVGIYLGETKFLHVRQNQTSVIESTQRPIWRNRLEGIYTYTPKSNAIQLTGIPHPFQQGKILEFIEAGTTVKECVDFITTKYKISTRLVKQLVIFVDGVLVRPAYWSTTVLKTGQQVIYKTVPQGRDGLRIILVIAAIAAGQFYGAKLASALFAESLSGFALKFATVATQAVVTFAALTLVNAIVPIRNARDQLDSPATSQQLNLFSGASNRANPYGAIPVVLGRLQFTPPLGSQPYIDSQTTTSYMHMQLVWGFGPLRVDHSEFYVGTNKINNYYPTGIETRPLVTVQGFTDPVTGNETETDTINRFNNLYPGVVEQQIKNVELTNYLTPANTETITFLETQATKIEAIISFPEGLRKINVKDGKSSASVVSLVATLHKIEGGVENPVTDWTTQTVFTQSINFIVLNEIYYYQKIVFAITPTSGIVTITGTPSTTLGDPGQQLIDQLKDYGLNYSNSNTYKFDPVIPENYKVLYSVVIRNDYLSINNQVLYNLPGGISNGTVTVPTPQIAASYSVNGFQLTGTAQTSTIADESGNSSTYQTGNWTISISPGTLGSSINNTNELQPVGGNLPGKLVIWNTKQFPYATSTSNSSAWGDVSGSNKTFMNEYSVWSGTTTTFDQQMSVQFPYSGIYTIQAAVDNSGEIIIAGQTITIPENSFSARTPVSSGSAPYQTNIRISKGANIVRVKALNLESPDLTPGSSNAGVAVLITFVPDNTTNYVPGANYITIGSNQFANYKDGFNYPITWNNLAPGKYKLSVVRNTTSDPDYEADYKHSFRCVFLSASAFKPGEISIQPPKGVGICRTGLVIESSGKVNGQIDGINALVQTLGWDYVIPNVLTPNTPKAWVNNQPINNPASLFVHVLMSKANAYSITPDNIASKINLAEIEDWHTYCNTPVPNVRPALTYNGIVSNTSSVLDVLKDICAAGMASPVFIDGKWSVVIDRERPHVVQHFTPHNTWGFEATKILPKLPDALRISFPDETNGFQITEILVANFGKTINTAKIIEEIQLPGITRIEQARYFARWHLAQLHYRPEIFTINVDFEYLICTRGDRVRVTHDVPLWGYGSGRIKSISGNQLALTLTESIYLETGKTYQIRIRTDNLTGTIGTGSVDRTIATISTSGYYDTLTVTDPVGNAVKVDDLFLIGENQKVSEDLLVQSIETTSNTTAKLIMVAYASNLYSYQFLPDVEQTPELPSFTRLISKRGSQTAQNTILSFPTLNSPEASGDLAEEISPGIYENVVVITWTNPINLPVVAEQVEFQIILGNEQFNDTKQLGAHIVRMEALTYTIRGLIKDGVYKMRARYRNITGTISGPWSDEVSVVVVSRNYNPFSVSDVLITLHGTTVTVKPVIQAVEPAEHKTYEFKLYRSNGTGDFWNTSWDADNMMIAQSRTQAVFNLLSLPSTSTNRRISTSGINYRIACRALNFSNNYSATSALGSILIKTIV